MLIFSSFVAAAMSSLPEVNPRRPAFLKPESTIQKNQTKSDQNLADPSQVQLYYLALMQWSQ